MAALLAAIWVVEAVNLLTGNAVNGWLGLRPRSLGGLDGIVFMPVLHGSVAHAAANTAPLAVLGALLVITARSVALMASLLIVILGGLGVWVFGSSAIHVGASGLIFGWFGFLVARGLVERRLVPVLVAVGVAVVYGTMIWGVLPGQPGVSWESHFFGALAGIATARALRGAA
ncbi:MULTISPECIES: rhomboid family intramembrane serine protease [unclassified Mameliella]|uniref:rhomboid family intramembrane serine protease n=1 Tax=unclassified Mameliella TaxID=2630630 RepID=UPI00273DB9D5|nr:MULTISPECIES: rhomboid family intramembrane serine protease [unclassified Mameliella]